MTSSSGGRLTLVTIYGGAFPFGDWAQGQVKLGGGIALVTAYLTDDRDEAWQLLRKQTPAPSDELTASPGGRPFSPSTQLPSLTGVLQTVSDQRGLFDEPSDDE